MFLQWQHVDLGTSGVSRASREIEGGLCSCGSALNCQRWQTYELEHILCQKCFFGP